MPRVDREARVHHPIGHPASKKFRAGSGGAGEPADVMAEIHQPRHAHPHTHPGVVLQGAPGGGIVTTPGLDITL